jgi:hypothetical protein
MYAAPRCGSSLGPAPLRSTSSASSLAPPVTPCARTVQKDPEETEETEKHEKTEKNEKNEETEVETEKTETGNELQVMRGPGRRSIRHKAEGWTSRRARGGGPTARGTQRGRSSWQ